MAQLRCKTLGDVSPRGKSRVYFACHPEDYKVYFQEIVDDLLKHCDCAVYYYDEEPEQDEEYYVNLDRIQLMVMPVTTRLLYLPNRAMDLEFSYAMEHHIPVLPLMQERGLEEKYGERFGNLQFLDKGNLDITAIPYVEKLKKYLNSVLLNDEQTAQVRAAFDAWIFLSYRKKDRKVAQELMRLIHSDPRCRDIAIWYDEFLNPGEDFNDAIRKALAESQLFMLAVTPNLLEKGNYVMREEYPEAKKSGKPILPAEMEATDRGALKEDFKDLPDPLDPSADGVVTEAVLDALGALAVREYGEDSRHNFFIGLAYLSGLYVEKDHDRAVKLITASAEAGLTEAMEKLVTMYETGEAVERDYRTAIIWREKLVQKARERVAVDLNEETFLCLMKRLFSLGEAKAVLPDLTGAKQAYMECHKLTQTRSKKISVESIHVCRAQVFDRLGDICVREGNLHDARIWYEKCMRVDKKLAEKNPQRGLRAFSFSYKNLGRLCQAEGNLPAARHWYLKATDAHEKLAESGTGRDLRSLAIRYEDMGDVDREIGDRLEARDWYQKAYRIREQMAETESREIARDLSVICEKLGYLCECEEDYSAASEWYCKSLNIREKLVQSETVESYIDLATSYERMGAIALARDELHEAQKWFEKSLRIIEKQSKPRPRACSRLLAVIYERMAAVCVKKRLLQDARSWYTKALEIRESMSDTEEISAFLDLSVSFRQLGSLSAEEGKLQESRLWYSKSVEICKRPVAAKSINCQRALADSYQKLGSISEMEGDIPSAYGWYIESLEVLETIAEKGLAEDLEQLAVLYCWLGDLAQKTTNIQPAVMYSAAMGIYRELMEEYPNVERYSSNVIILMEILAETDSQSNS